jgi:glyoxylate/hydroxypyruvate reductase
MDKAGKSLKVIATMSVGFDHIDIAEAKKRGIHVGFTPGVLTDATAELTVAVLLAASRRLFESHQELLSGGWERSNWGPMWMTGPGLANSTVGIFGLGRIGMGVMARLRGFNVGRFLYHDVAPRTDNVDATFVDFDTLLRESDFIVTMCSLTDETREIFNERAFSLMKPNAVFVNTSRGGVVKQSALIDALKTKKIFAAGLDVMTPEPLPVNHELLKLPNCVVLPHIASASWESRTEMALLTAKNILAALDGSPTLPAGVC